MSARDFSGKVVFITGAAHGQGRAVAKAFAAPGAVVAGSGLVLDAGLLTR